MIANDSSSHSDRAAHPPPPATAGFTRVVACVGSGEPSSRVILHAATIANALDVPLMLLRVFETRSVGGVRLDPVDWEIRRREAYARVEALAEDFRYLCADIEAEVVEGQAAEQISLWAQQHPADLTVLGTHGEWRPAGWGLGDTAREVVERAAGSLLLVPCSAQDVSMTGYRRLLVPIDGSCRAESVLPFAIRLAKAQRAELLLAHVVPPSTLTEVGPPESEDLELCERLARRNERVARQYLEQLQNRASETGVTVRTRVLFEDVRSSLARLAADEAVDIVVLSAQGCSGRVDVPYGSVASFLMTHTRQPVLIMRQPAPAPALVHGNGGGGARALGFPLTGVW